MSTAGQTADEVIAVLDLEPLPGEGGYYRQTHADEGSTAIYFLMTPGEFSAMHRLGGPELWHFYAGAAAAMLLLHPDGSITEPVLGVDLAAGERPQMMVDAGVWMGAATTGDWTLVGTTMTPPFDPATFELATVDEVVAGWPAADAAIRKVVRP